MPFKTISRFFSETIWTKPIDTMSLSWRLWYRTLRVIHIVLKGFRDERLNQQAAALTYVSFLSVIPLIAVLFSLGKAFGFQKSAEPWVREHILSRRFYQALKLTKRLIEYEQEVIARVSDSVESV